MNLRIIIPVFGPPAFIHADADAVEAILGGPIQGEYLKASDNILLLTREDAINVGLQPNLRDNTGHLFIGPIIANRFDSLGSTVDVTPDDMELIRSFVDGARRSARIHYRSLPSDRADTPQRIITYTGIDLEPHA